MTRTRERLEK